MAEAWLHFFEVPDAAQRTAVQASLAREGIVVAGLGQKARPKTGVLVFGEITAALYDLLRENSNNGVERVLAVSLVPRILPKSEACQLLAAGASDVLRWGRASETAKAVAARLRRWSEVQTLVDSALVRDNLAGQSPVWLSTLRDIAGVARFSSTDILVLGETGTGKELVAQLVHALDGRSARKDLVVLDCTTLVPELAGSEFFGHERGAFTGAVAARDGAFALADCGTLFLDEVGDLPLPLQAKLLRVVQEHTYKRVGGNQWRRTNFRLVCASSRDLRTEVMRGGFRSDLYYRIAGAIFKLPPLRDRTEDIIHLATFFLRTLSGNGEAPELDGSVREVLLNREYPGNVRDLKQLIARVVACHVGPGSITLGEMPPEERVIAQDQNGSESWLGPELDSAIRRALALGVGMKAIGRAVEDAAVRVALRDGNGSLKLAAKKLCVTARALQMRRAATRAQGEARSRGHGAESLPRPNQTQEVSA